MDIPTSWTDLNMTWDASELAPVNPYFIAISEAIKERAINRSVEDDINSMLLDPSVFYVARDYAEAIQDAVTLLIPLFGNPNTDYYDAWTEADILTEIGAVSRISSTYYFTKKWANQQYDILNQLLHQIIENVTATVIVSRTVAPPNYERKIVAELSLANMVTLYNSLSIIEAPLGREMIIYCIHDASASGNRIEGTRNNVTIFSNDPIPAGAAVDADLSFTSNPGYTFVPVGLAQQKDVFYRVASSWISPGGFISIPLGVIVEPPDEVTVEMFPTKFNNNKASQAQIVYRLPDEDFNFKL